ncbi:hypothetical protein ACIRYZ_44150 [Kitasatospora sp. NPDC101155]
MLVSSQVTSWGGYLVQQNFDSQWISHISTGKLRPASCRCAPRPAWA